MVVQYAFKIKHLTAHDSLLGKHWLFFCFVLFCFRGIILYFVLLLGMYNLIGSLNSKPVSPVHL